MANKCHLRKTTYTLIFSLVLVYGELQIHLRWTKLVVVIISFLILPCYRCMVNGILKFVGAGEFSKFLFRMAVGRISISHLVLLLFVFSPER